MNIMGLAEIMDRSVEDLRKYFKTVVLFYLCFGVITLVAFFILIILGAVFAAFFANLFENFIFLTAVILVFTLLTATLFAAANTGMIKIASQEFTFSGEKVYAFDAVTVSFKNIFKVFGIIAASIIIFLPVIAALSAVGYFIVKGYEQVFDIYMNNKIIIILGIVFTVIIAILALVIITACITLVSFSFHAAVIEKKGILSSMHRSYSLVKPDFWKTFGCLILFQLTVYAITYSIESLAGILTGLIYLILKFLNIENSFISYITSAANYISYPLSLLSWLVIAPTGVIMTTLLYFNQRFKLEGYDLSLRLESIKKYNERVPENGFVE